MKIKVVSSLQDNYIYILHDAHGNAVVADPGDAAACLTVLKENQWRLAAVLITHRHADHIGGLPQVRAAHPHAAVYAPAECGIDNTHRCADGQRLTLLDGALPLTVLATPGHTLEHIVYVGDGFVLSGDTLFTGGCGRVLEGNMRQMHDSLAALAALPDETRIYCGHEYTLANLRFATAVEPENRDIQIRLAETEAKRAAGKATVPATLAEERRTNPFLRLTMPAVIAAAEAQSATVLADSVAVFSALRSWKDGF